MARPCNVLCGVKYGTKRWLEPRIQSIQVAFVINEGLQHTATLDSEVFEWTVECVWISDGLLIGICVRIQSELQGQNLWIPQVPQGIKEMWCAAVHQLLHLTEKGRQGEAKIRYTDTVAHHCAIYAVTNLSF